MSDPFVTKMVDLSKYCCNLALQQYSCRCSLTWEVKFGPMMNECHQCELTTFPDWWVVIQIININSVLHKRKSQSTLQMGL